MDWIKKHYDGVVLLLVAILCLAVAGWALSRIFGVEDLFTDRNSSKPRDNTIAPANVEPLAAGVASLKALPKWDGHDGSLFASRIYILKEGELVDPIEGDRPLHPPVPNEWLLRYDLDYTQSDILEADPDTDGFTILEEWRASTDPTDEDSVPPYWTKLRVQDFEQIPFKVKFSGSPDGGETFTINFIDDRSRPTQFLTLGEEIDIAGVPYTLAKFEPKTEMDNNFERDVSELILEDKASGQRIVLVKDQIVNSPTSFGSFLNLIDGQVTEKIQIGDTFSVQQAPDIKYRLDEITAERAIVTKESTGEKLEIPRQ
jgi:hypothetical protein